MAIVRTAAAAITLFLFISACTIRPEPTAGMDKQEMAAVWGQPKEKWTGTNGVECWEYGDFDSTLVLLKNGKVVKATVPASLRNNFENLMIGLPEAAVKEMLGKPAAVEENKNGKKLSYIMKTGRTRKFHYVRFVNGVVESYGLDSLKN
jgi:hypothetical protein